jgi:hypothetical protein
VDEVLKYSPGDMLGLYEVLYCPVHLFTAIAETDCEVIKVDRHVSACVWAACAVNDGRLLRTPIHPQPPQPSVPVTLRPHVVPANPMSAALSVPIVMIILRRLPLRSRLRCRCCVPLQEMHKLKRDHPVILTRLQNAAKLQIQPIRERLGASVPLPLPFEGDNAVAQRPPASAEVKAAAARAWNRARSTSTVCTNVLCL